MATVEKQRKSNGKRPGGCTGKGFKPGESGNPGGKRKGTLSLKAKVLKVLESEAKNKAGKGMGKTVADVIAEVWVREAAMGKWPPTKELIDRIDGKVPDRITPTGPLEVTIRYVDEPPSHDEQSDTD